MSEVLLNIDGLRTEVEGKEILKGFKLTNKKRWNSRNNGTKWWLVKSTLANTLMAHPKYKMVSGEVIFFEGEDISELKTDERARKGLFLSFQHPEEVPGITVGELYKKFKNCPIDGQLN